MTNREAANELKNYHREDGTVPEEITLAIKALEQIDLIEFNIHALNELIKEADNETDN